MSMFGRTVSGDLAFPLVVVTDPKAVAEQKVQDAFDLWFQTWAFDQSQGFPWKQIVGIKNPNLTQARALIRKALFQIVWVTSVLEVSLTLDRVKRNLDWRWQARINTGTIIQGGGSQSFSPAAQ